MFREIARILKPGGRLAISDIALKKPLPEELANDIAAYVGCVAGASLLDDYRKWLLQAGFSTVEIIDSGSDLNVYAEVEKQSGCCSPAMSTSELPIVDLGCASSSDCTDGVHERLAELLTRYDVNEYAASVKVLAVKP